MPELVLSRHRLLTNVTLGRFYVNGKLLCCTLELPWLKNAKGKSCVPVGTYSMEYSYSPAFRRNTWRLLDVPGRDGILIHAANYTRQLKGCIAPCMDHADMDKDGIIDGVSSGKALDLVEDLLRPLQSSVVKLEIRNYQKR
jgi:hypothetical protein